MIVEMKPGQIDKCNRGLPRTETRERKRPGIFRLSIVLATLLIWCTYCYLDLLSDSARTQLPFLTFPSSVHNEIISCPTAAVSTSISDSAHVEITTASASRTLIPLRFTPLPLGSIKPRGWLASELSNSANGLAGHLHDFYAYVKYSPWYGHGSEYSDLNEGFPYWFNALVPLAYGLPDHDADAVRLKSQVHTAANYVLDRQAEDGWLGPETGSDRWMWARFPLCLGLTQLAEANATWAVRIVPALQRYVSLTLTMLANGGQGFSGTGTAMWGRVRAADMIMTLQWMLEKYPSDEFDDVIWQTMQTIYNLSLKWEAWYHEGVYIKDDLYRVPNQEVDDVNFPYQHAVNVAQGFKAPAVIHRFTQNSSLPQTAADGVEWSFRYHGTSSGTILGDERLVGLSPYSGSELCTAVEAIFSLSYLYEALGTNSHADRAELAAFNALPTMLTGDHWAHQYMAEPNQPYARDLTASPFYNSRELAQSFGLEPNYPCCTVNHPQGLPKFLSNSWTRVNATGLAHVLLSPGYVTLGNTTIHCDTTYPFGETLIYSITAAAAFPFFVRVPEWAGRSSSISLNGSPAEPVSPDPTTGLHQLDMDEGNFTVTYTLSASIVVQQRANDSMAVTRGALLYALEIGSANISQTPRSFGDRLPFKEDYAPPQSRDWTFSNTTAWNIAIDPSTLAFHVDPVGAANLPSQVWAPGGPPLYMTAQGCQIDWPLFRNSVPGAIPMKAKRKCLGPPYEVRLVPYGSAKLHMAEIPTIVL